MRDTSKRLRLATWLQGEGVEIGALDNPLELPPSAAARHVDQLPVESLAPLADATTDFVIANHLLQHLEDPIAALMEFERVLKPGGVVYLALPDQRLTLDRDRRPTLVEHLLEEHRTGSAPANRRDHYFDWAENVAKSGSQSEAQATALMESSYRIHFHVWRPDTFLEFFSAARRETGLDLELLEFAPPESEDDDEFILILGKGALGTVSLPPSMRTEDAPAKRVRLAAWLRGEGIEIGALHNPLSVPPPASVRYVDHLPVAALRRHYPELNDLPLVHVDLIGSAENLSVLTDGSADFVIANHLMEHLEDPIAALKEFERVLKPAGIVYLALPDKRLTFDHDRELTPLQHLLDEHRGGSSPANRGDHYLDWARNVDKKGSESEAHAAALMTNGYSIHFHVWRPETFLDFFFAARRAARLELELVEFAPPEIEGDIEFILILAKGRGDVALMRPSAATSDRPASPAPPPVTLRRRLAASPIGPPVRAVKRLAGRLARSR